MAFSIKKLVNILLHLPGVIILIFVILFVVAMLLPTTPKSDIQQDVNSIIARMDSLTYSGDFFKISLPFEVNCWDGVFLDAETKDGVPIIGFKKARVTPPGPSRYIYDEEFFQKKIDFPVCHKNEVSVKPCVEGYQHILIEGLGKNIGFSYIEESKNVFHDIFRRDTKAKIYKTDKSSIELFVSEAGRILLLAPDANIVYKKPLPVQI